MIQGNSTNTKIFIKKGQRYLPNLCVLYLW